MTQTSAVDATSLVAVVEALLAESDESKLPSLTREELLAVSASPALLHVADVTWWAGLELATRAVVRSSAQRSLLARNLLLAGPTPEALALADELRLILAARQYPSVVLAGHELDEQGSVADLADRSPDITVLGIDLHDDHRDALLLSTEVAGVYAHRLTRPALGIGAVAKWLRRPGTSDAVQLRHLQVVRPAPDADGTSSTTQFLVLRSGSAGYEGSIACSAIDGDGRAGDPLPLDHDELLGWLTQLVDDRTHGAAPSVTGTP